MVSSSLPSLLGTSSSSSSSGSSTLMALKAQSQSKSLEDRKIQERQRDCLVLILNHLRSCGYIGTATQLVKESSPFGNNNTYFNKVEIADNMSLIRVMKEYEDYHYMKFQQKPKFTRKRVKISRDESEDINAKFEKHQQRNSRINNKKQHMKKLSNPRPTTAYPNGHSTTTSFTSVQKQQNEAQKENRNSTMSMYNDVSTSSNSHCRTNHLAALSVKSFQKGSSISNTHTNNESVDDDEKENHTRSERDNRNHDYLMCNSKILKPLPNFGSDDLTSLAQTLRRDILQTNPNVTWKDVIDLEEAKQTLKEAVVLPLRYPELFSLSPLITPWRGILLFGPPGNGKTFLAKAVATETKTTFFNMSSSSLVSKYRGDSEKLVRVLFEMARFYAPSTIFLDEIDSLMGHRGGGPMKNNGGDESNNEHEGSRRMKTELLMQMDGIHSSSSHTDDTAEYEISGNNHDRSNENITKKLVFVLAASNLPWDLDVAFLRRFEKRIMIGLPTSAGRERLIRQNFGSLASKNSEEIDLKHMATKTEGFSAADIKLLCKEIAMKPVRRILKKLDELDEGRENEHNGRGNMNHNSLINQELFKLMKENKIISSDVEEGLNSVKSAYGSNKAVTEKYESWAKKFGSV